MKLRICRLSGFSLVEILAVVVIIGLLVEIAMPRFIDLRSQSRQAANDASARVMNSAMDIARLRGEPVTDFSTVEAIYDQLASKGLVSEIVPVKNQNMTIQSNPDGTVFLIGTFD